MEKKDLLKDTIKHIDIKSYDSTQLIDAMRDMSFTSRDTARATDILMMMVGEKECTNILTIAGSTSAAGCMQVYVDMVRNKMVDVVVSTGASIIDMDLFEALGYKHYKGHQDVPDMQLTVFTIRSLTRRNYKLATTRPTRLQTAWNPVPIHRVNLSGKSGNGYMKDTP